MFISWAAPRYKINTIKVTMNALCDWCKSVGSDTSSVMNKVTKELLSTVEREQGSEGLPVGKLGMTKAVLKLIISWCAEKARNCDHGWPHLFYRDICWLVIEFFTSIRRSELIALKMSDVVLRGTSTTSHISINIRKSKTDKKGEGIAVAISGATSEGWDLFSKVERYKNIRLEMGASPNDPFLVGWDLDQMCLGPKALANGQALAARMRTLLKDILQKIPGLDINPEAYGMHSLRRGGVVAAWAAGVDVEKNRHHGLWKSDAFRSYLTAGLDIKLSVTAAM
jgi:hypothetical protein